MSKKRKLLQTNNECTKTETNNENSDKLTSVLSQSTESGDCFQWCEASGSVVTRCTGYMMQPDISLSTLGLLSTLPPALAVEHCYWTH